MVWSRMLFGAFQKEAQFAACDTSAYAVNGIFSHISDADM